MFCKKVTSGEMTLGQLNQLPIKQINSCLRVILIYSLFYFHCRLKQAGIEFPTVAIGATPSCSKPPDDVEGINEFHPGNYVFYGW